MSEALVKSLNVPAVEVLDQLEPNRFVAALRSGGLKLDFPKGESPNLSVILGGAGTTLEQRMLSPGAAFIIRDVLESDGPIARALEEGRGQRRGVAWKTGTSFGFRDAWAIGVSDQFTIGVWIGRPDGTPNPGFFGANIAAPLLVDIFAALDPQPPAVHTPPASVQQQKICWPLGTAYNPAEESLCHQQRTAWILQGTAPPHLSRPIAAGRGAIYI